MITDSISYFITNLFTDNKDEWFKTVLDKPRDPTLINSNHNIKRGMVHDNLDKK